MGEMGNFAVCCSPFFNFLLSMSIFPCLDTRTKTSCKWAATSCYPEESSGYTVKSTLFLYPDQLAQPGPGPGDLFSPSRL